MWATLRQGALPRDVTDQLEFDDTPARALP